MQIQPYLFFDGSCEQAIDFYVQQLGAEVEMMMRYKEMPEQAKQEGGPEMDPESIMHACLRIGDSRLMASDGCPQEGDAAVTHKGYSLSLNPNDVEQGRELFHKLAQDGNITMPYQPTFWAKGFGMLTDKFGVNWMVNVE
ncbi:VOC family metalloprotein YjdN [Serratia sp. AKBS12]|uniref:VOC family metalloprotein YjdN n=1 Tax=Serratia sp. AKBS12 TaxID=2974597 RepID=UPI002165E539|nr:VOC family metalloprotein YjdN [Serratia sp. AKBS12]MCS3408069.1 VOC family metalloprotein YjdN [Serratia sp. AKBS12]HEI8866258.1 VOC family metalloprotein YjdN [Serratia odorifera]